jgi:hypothetical protein
MNVTEPEISFSCVELEFSWDWPSTTGQSKTQYLFIDWFVYLLLSQARGKKFLILIYESRVLFIISTCDDNRIKKNISKYSRRPCGIPLVIDFLNGRPDFYFVVFISAIRHVPFLHNTFFIFFLGWESFLERNRIFQRPCSFPSCCIHPPRRWCRPFWLFFFFLAHMSIRLCYIVIDLGIFSSIFLCLLSSPRPATAFSFPFFSLSLSSFLLYFKLRLVLYPAVFIITPSSVGPLQLRIAHM